MIILLIVDCMSRCVSIIDVNQIFRSIAKIMIFVMATHNYGSIECTQCVCKSESFCGANCS